MTLFLEILAGLFIFALFVAVLATIVDFTMHILNNKKH